MPNKKAEKTNTNPQLTDKQLKLLKKIEKENPSLAADLHAASTDVMKTKIVETVQQIEEIQEKMANDEKVQAAKEAYQAVLQPYKDDLKSLRDMKKIFLVFLALKKNG